VRDVRTFLRHPIQAIRDPKEAFGPEGPAILHPWRQMLLNLAYVGGVGLASDLVRALSVRRAGEAVASFLGGPAFTEGMEALVLMRELATKPARGVRRTVRKAIDLLITPALALTFGIPGSVLGETMERERVDARVAEEHLEPAACGGVSVHCSRDVSADRVKHG